MEPWAGFILGVVCAEIAKMFYLIGKKELERRREAKLLRFVRVEFPDNKSIYFTTIETANKKAMDDLQRQIFESRIKPVDEQDDFKMIPFPKRPRNKAEEDR